MRYQHAAPWSRREFLGELDPGWNGRTLGGITGPADAEPPPEMTTIRLIYSPGLCISPMYVAEELLQGKGSLLCSISRRQRRAPTRCSPPARPTSP